MFLGLCLILCSCGSQKKDGTIITRTFLHDCWERFDYLNKEVEITSPVTYNLQMEVTFTDEYEDDHFAITFTIFDADGEPYRAKGYDFKLKDENGAWKSVAADGTHTFVFPINKELTLSDAGNYKFEIDNRMPITPLVGVRQLKLYDIN